MYDIWWTNMITSLQNSYITYIWNNVFDKKINWFWFVDEYAEAAKLMPWTVFYFIVIILFGMVCVGGWALLFIFSVLMHSG